MTARLLEGAPAARRILERTGQQVALFKESRGRAPGLGVVLVGSDPASTIYVGKKKTESEALGMVSQVKRLAEESTTSQVVEAVESMNRDDTIDGILVQLPLPPQIDEDAVLQHIHPAKDVDGLHPENVGLLVKGKPRFVPCTPAGILELLDRERIPLLGQRAVVIGRSEIVGKPIAFMLLHGHATVTICHSKTPDLASVCASADILIAAIGRPAMITGSFIKQGATVIDVGISRVTDPCAVISVFGEGHSKLKRLKRKGCILLGDVHPLDGMEKAGAITPVPGGVGPLTIAMLLHNTMKAANHRA